MDYSHIADCMGCFSSPDTLKYMTENMAGQDVGTHIARAVFYFLTSEPDEATDYINRIKEESIADADLTRRELYGALLDRLSLGKYHTVPHWMLFKIRTGNELVYPFVPVFEKLEIKDNRYVLYLKDVCPSCKKKTVLSENGFLVPLTSASDTVWYCPHCLAKREFSSLQVKNVLWEQFKAFLARQPHREDGTLEENALSAVICMAQALYPLAPVRFGRLWTEAIGHLAMNPSVYIQARAKKLLAPSMDYIGVDYSGFMANAYLAEKWKEVFELSPIGPQIYKEVQFTPLAVSELTNGPHSMYYDPEGAAGETPAPFSFRLDEHVRARNELEKMGVPADAPFVCLHVRNKTYTEKYHTASPDVTSCRNADINTYRLAAEFLAQQGYYVLRTGMDVPGPLEWASDHIIDYAVDHRSEFMDVWLFCNCALCLSTGTGPDALSQYFRRPLIYSNYYQPVCYEMAYFWNILFLPKTLVHIRNGRRVTCAEAARMQLIRHGQGSLEKFGIRTVDNTPEELLEAVKEKLALLNGTWTSDPLLEKLQDRHLALSIASLHYYSSEQREKMRRMHSRKKGFARMTRIASCYLKADYEEECRRKGKVAGVSEGRLPGTEYLAMEEGNRE